MINKTPVPSYGAVSPPPGEIPPPPYDPSPSRGTQQGPAYVVHLHNYVPYPRPPSTLAGRIMSRIASVLFVVVFWTILLTMLVSVLSTPLGVLSGWLTGHMGSSVAKGIEDVSPAQYAAFVDAFGAGLSKEELKSWTWGYYETESAVRDSLGLSGISDDVSFNFHVRVDPAIAQDSVVVRLLAGYRPEHVDLDVNPTSCANATFVKDTLVLNEDTSCTKQTHFLLKTAVVLPSIKALDEFNARFSTGALTLFESFEDIDVSALSVDIHGGMTSIQGASAQSADLTVLSGAIEIGKLSVKDLTFNVDSGSVKGKVAVSHAAVGSAKSGAVKLGVDLVPSDALKYIVDIDVASGLADIEFLSQPEGSWLDLTITHADAVRLVHAPAFEGSFDYTGDLVSVSPPRDAEHRVSYMTHGFNKAVGKVEWDGSHVRGSSTAKGDLVKVAFQ